MKTQELIFIRLVSTLFKIKTIDIVRFVKEFNSLRNKSGITFAIKYMKTSRLHITRYICNRPLKSNSDLVSLTKDYFPKRFLYLKHYIDSNNKIFIRGILTMFYYTRSIRPTKSESAKLEPSFKSITDLPKNSKFYTIPGPFIKEFVRKHKLSLDKPKYDQDLHYISTKSSPYGKSTFHSTYGLFSMSNVHHNILNYFIGLIGEKAYTLLFGNLIRSM